MAYSDYSSFVDMHIPDKVMLGVQRYAALVMMKMLHWAGKLASESSEPPRNLIATRIIGSQKWSFESFRKPVKNAEELQYPLTGDRQPAPNFDTSGFMVFAQRLEKGGD